MANDNDHATKKKRTLWTAPAPAASVCLIGNPDLIDPAQVVADTRSKLERLSLPFKRGVRAATLKKPTG